MLTISSIFWLFIILNLFLLYRINKVYIYRTDLLWDDFEAYNRLPSYDEMVWKFWVWDLDRFIEEE